MELTALTKGAACLQLASIDPVTTLYVRDVPAEVAATLKRRAASEGMSLSAYVAAQLGQLASRPTNSEIVERLRQLDRSQGPSSAEIVSALAQSRR